MPKMWRNLCWWYLRRSRCWMDDPFKELDAANRLGCCRLETTPTLSLAGLPKLQFLTYLLQQNLCLSQQNLRFSRRNVCWNKNMFVAKDMCMFFVATKSGQTFVATKSGQTFVATRPGQTFLATKIVVVSASANDASSVLPVMLALFCQWC